LTELTSNKLGLGRIIAFSLPNIVSGIIARPVAYILPSLYAKYLGIELDTIALILLLTRLLDVVTDPLIGYLSDKTKSRFGKRKPWILAGFVLAFLCISQLFFPPDNPGGWFFGIWFGLVLLAWTLVEIPTSAWLVELTSEHNERTRIASFRVMFGITGEAIFALLPMLPLFAISEITPEVLNLAGGLMMAAIPVALFFSLRYVPQGEKHAVQVDTSDLASFLKGVITNKPAIIYVVSMMLSGIGFGIVNGLFFFFVDTYLAIGERLPIILLFISFGYLVGIPIWLQVYKIWERSTVWSVTSLLAVMVIIPMMTLVPGEGVFLKLLVLVFLFALVNAAFAVANVTILADVIDYDYFRSGSIRPGKYNAFLSLLVKANGALGGALAFFLLNLFGYDATTTEHTAREVMGLKLAMGGVGPVLIACSAILIWFFPITRARHAVIVRWNQRRSAP